MVKSAEGDRETDLRRPVRQTVLTPRHLAVMSTEGEVDTW